MFSAAQTRTILAVVSRHAREVAAQMAAMAGELRATAASKGGAVDVVTAADTWSERELTGRLHRLFPDHRIAGEEGTRLGPEDSPWTWHLDPLDGTANFSRNLPYWAISIGLSHGDVPVLGVIVGPACRIDLAGAVGLGVWSHGQRLPSLVPAGPEKTWIVASDWPWRLEERPRVQDFLGRLAPRIRQFKTYGSAAIDLSHVALGLVDAYAIPGIFPWDQCAGAAICASLGAEFARWDASPWDLRHADIICARPGMLPTLTAATLPTC